MENTSSQSHERRIYKRDGFVHITLGSVYYAPPFNVTQAKVGQRLQCTPLSDGTCLVATDKDLETWHSITNGGLQKPVRGKAKETPAK